MLVYLYASCEFNMCHAEIHKYSVAEWCTRINETKGLIRKSDIHRRGQKVKGKTIK